MTENINTEELFATLDHTTSELIELISSFSEHRSMKFLLQGAGRQRKSPSTYHKIKHRDS